MKENEKEKITLETVNQEVKATTLKNDKTGKVIGDYVEVNQRVMAFRKLYPEGRIDTELLYDNDGKCSFKAYIYRNIEDEKPLATGTAYEKENSTFINKTSYIENCETSAVGRALGFLGIGIDTSIASKEEVINAVINQEEKPTILATEKQVKMLEQYYKNENLTKLLETNNIQSLNELTIEKASELIKKIMDNIDKQKAEKETIEY